MFGSLVFAFSQTALISDHSLSHIFTLQKCRPHLPFTTCYQPRGRTIQLCHTLISAVRLSLSRNGSKHHAWRSRRISRSSTHTSLSYTSTHFTYQHVSFHEVTALWQTPYCLYLLSLDIALASVQHHAINIQIQNIKKSIRHP